MKVHPSKVHEASSTHTHTLPDVIEVLIRKETVKLNTSARRLQQTLGFASEEQ